MKSKRLILTLVIAGVLVGVLVSARLVLAGSNPSPAGDSSQQPGIANSTCLACHGKPDQTLTLPSGEVLYLTVDQNTYDHSVHGEKGYACVQCHTNITGYPHPPLTATTLRDVTLSLYVSCKICHSGMFDLTKDSTHQVALDAGNKNAAVCTDCHGAHDITPPDQPRSKIPQTCERCHSEIYNEYKDSVHGAALIGDGNPDVPSCIDCHGVHNVSGPSNSNFRLLSPQICAKCHTDPARMNKYNISTNVLNTYVADFHGTTVEIFEKTAAGQQTNKPVCVDCHGVHNIRNVNDPQSTVIKQNLLATCKKCHPDATANFPTAWLSHYTPSPTEYPVVYYVTLFYRYFVPIVLGSMAFFVMIDFLRRFIFRRREVIQ